MAGLFADRAAARTAGIEVVDIDGLTGLAEYRNGGLFVDTGVLRLTDPADAAARHPVADPLVVGWRALTVALLDRMAPLVRERLGVDEAETSRWPACSKAAPGRRAGASPPSARAGGGPPFTIISDGTVF